MWFSRSKKVTDICIYLICWNPHLLMRFIYLIQRLLCSFPLYCKATAWYKSLIALAVRDGTFPCIIVLLLSSGKHFTHSLSVLVVHIDRELWKNNQGFVYPNCSAACFLPFPLPLFLGGEGGQGDSNDCLIYCFCWRHQMEHIYLILWFECYSWSVYKKKSPQVLFHRDLFTSCIMVQGKVKHWTTQVSQSLSKLKYPMNQVVLCTRKVVWGSNSSWVGAGLAMQQLETVTCRGITN